MPECEEAFAREEEVACAEQRRKKGAYEAAIETLSSELTGIRYRFGLLELDLEERNHLIENLEYRVARMEALLEGVLRVLGITVHDH